MRWVAVMACHPDEGTEVVRFKPEYFQWLENQVFSIQDFPYAGVDFRGDPDMALPPGEQWDDSGKIIFNIFLIFIFFYFLYRPKTDSKNFKMQMWGHSNQLLSDLTRENNHLHRLQPHRTNQQRLWPSWIAI